MKLNFVGKIVSFVLLVVNLAQLQAQNCKDLETRLGAQLEDTSKVLLFDELVKCLNDVDGNKALEYNQQALALSEKLRYNKGMILSLVRVKGILLKTGKYDELLARIDRGTRLCLQEKDTFWFIRYRYALADCYVRIGRSGEAVKIAEASLVLAKSRKDEKIIPLLLALISLHYFVTGEYEKALQFQFESLAFAEKIKRNTAILGSLGDISITYNYLRTDSTAFFNYTQRGIALSESMGEYSTRSTLYNNLGDYNAFLGKPAAAIQAYLIGYQSAIAAKYDKNKVHAAIHLALNYAALKDAGKAEQYRAEAVQAADQINDPNMQGDVFLTSGDMLFDQSDYEGALASFKKALALKSKGLTTPAYLQALEKAAFCAAQVHQYQEAYEFGAIARILSDSLLDVKRLNEVNNIERKYGLQQKDAALRLSKIDLERKRFAIQSLELTQRLLEKDNEFKQSAILQREDSLQGQQALFNMEKVANASAAQLKELEAQKNLSRWKWTVLILGILMANLFIGLIFFRNRQRLKLRLAQTEKSRAIEQLRRETAQDVHDLVGRELTLIGLEARYGAMAPHTSEDALRKKLLELAEKSNQTGNHLSTMVLAINPETDAFPLVQAAFKEICVSTFSDSAVKLELHFMRTPDDELILLKPDIKRQLSMILIESLNNVLKYAQANTVMVRFQCIQNGRFLLEIQDDGVGFEPESAQKTTSFGLTGMKTRAAKIGADFTIESAPGKGTWVKVSGFL